MGRSWLKNAHGVPTPYEENGDVIRLREAMQHDYCFRKTLPYVVPIGNVCPKCHYNVYAYSPPVNPFDVYRVRSCPWCGMDFEAVINR